MFLDRCFYLVQLVGTLYTLVDLAVDDRLIIDGRQGIFNLPVQLL